MRAILLGLILMACRLPLHGQDSAAVFNDLNDYIQAQHTNTDSPGDSDNGLNTRSFSGEPVKMREFDKENWKEIVGSTDYNESTRSNQNKTSTGNESGSENERREDKTESNEIQVSTPWNIGGLQVLSYIIIIAVVLLIVFYIIKNTTINHKLPRKDFPVESEPTVDNIEDLNVEELIQRALSEGNFRLVVRLYYLGLLKRLNEKKLIVWEKDKTNLEYLSELFSKDYLYEDVQQLTLAYERIWYGEHTPEQDALQTIIGNFEQVNQKLLITKTS